MAGTNSMSNLEVIIGGIRVEGWSADSDAYMPPQELDAVGVKVGGDGTHERHRKPEYGGELVIKLLSSSPTVGKFMTQIQRQENGDDVDWDGHGRNLNTNAATEYRNGAAIKWPLGEQFGAEEVSTMVFTFDYETIIPTPGRGRVRQR